jgi:hypothetical protein
MTSPHKTGGEGARERACGFVGCAIVIDDGHLSMCDELTSLLEAHAASLAEENRRLREALAGVGGTYTDSKGWLRCRLCRAIVRQVGRLEVCEPPCLGAIARRALATPGTGRTE